MNWNLALRRNRFKNKPKVQEPQWQWPAFVIEWRRYVRRAALVVLLAGGLGALTWALDRPVRVISMDGSFQRVSPGQIEKAVAPFAHAGFMSADLDGIQNAIEADRKSTRLNSSHQIISYAVFCLKKKNKNSLIPSARRVPAARTANYTT